MIYIWEEAAKIDDRNEVTVLVGSRFLGLLYTQMSQGCHGRLWREGRGIIVGDAAERASAPGRDRVKG